MRQRMRSYGPDASQFGDLYEGGDRGVAVLIHGGFWRDRYDLTLSGEPPSAHDHHEHEEHHHGP